MNQKYCETVCKPSRKSKRACDSCPKPVLLPQNARVFDLFFACFTQWRLDAHGNRSIDYAAVSVAAGFMSIDVTAGVFEKFRVMEREYLTVMEARQDGT